MHYARMTGHDYREGYYFVTINTAPRRDCLSRIVGGKVELLPFGEIVLRAYLQMSIDSPEIDLRVCAIMPDHFHAIIAFRRRGDPLAHGGAHGCPQERLGPGPWPHQMPQRRHGTLDHARYFILLM